MSSSATLLQHSSSVNAVPSSSTSVLSRRLSASPCPPMPHTPQYEPLDSSSTSPTETLASIRLLVLSYLSDLEAYISEKEASWKERGETTVEDLRQWSRTTLDMLENIRSDVHSHLPDLSMPPDIPGVEEFILTRLLPDRVRQRFDEFSSKLPDMPRLSDCWLPDVRAKLEEVSATFNSIDVPHSLSFAPRLSEHFSQLHSHLASIDISAAPFSFPSVVLNDLLDSLMKTEYVQEVLAAADKAELSAGHQPPHGAESPAVQAVIIARGVKRSVRGSRLVTFADIPHQWKSNPFVRQGYRFIPIDNWHLILLSIFMFHNETLNIHTHLIPAVSWCLKATPLFQTRYDTPELVFLAFALVCLFSSALWHIMAGCAHVHSMEFCARLDYVGIGWLIAASVGTVVFYGFQCSPMLGNTFLLLCFATGVAGSIFPFMDWFNTYEYRNSRIAFFLSLAFSSIAPIIAMGYLHSFKQTYDFIAPLIPSFASYIAGLFFYATHVPECFLPEPWARKLDIVGGGSHCIWHCFIVLAVYLHKSAIAGLKDGFPCSA